MDQFGNRSITPYQLASLSTCQPQRKTIEETAISFEDVLKAKAEDKQTVAFSKHASERLNSRNIALTDGQMERLNQGIKQARDKRINESLVMLDNLAFIVNIKNNTVVTALSNETESNHVFTNIDGAVIV